jgi:hypothetical protein
VNDILATSIPSVEGDMPKHLQNDYYHHIVTKQQRGSKDFSLAASSFAR